MTDYDNLIDEMEEIQGQIDAIQASDAMDDVIGKGQDALDEMEKQSKLFYNAVRQSKSR